MSKWLVNNGPPKIFRIACWGKMSAPDFYGTPSKKPNKSQPAGAAAGEVSGSHESDSGHECLYQIPWQPIW